MSSMPVAIAETTRGGITESVHYGVVVAVDASGDGHRVRWRSRDRHLLPLVRQAVSGDPGHREWRGRRIRLHSRRAGALLRLSRRLA